jgi:hypothetical protein
MPAIQQANGSGHDFAVMEPAAEPGVLQDSTNAVKERLPEAQPQAGFIPRSKARTPPIKRKIRELQLETWGQEEELTLKPHK